MRQWVACVAAAMLGSAGTIWLLNESTTGTNPVSAQNGPVAGVFDRAERPPLPPTLFNSDGLTPDEMISVAVYEHCNRSVVNISTTGLRTGSFLMMAVPEEGSGSGAVLDKAGHILTNFHVIDRARQVQVTLFNDESYPAKLVGADPVNDLAVIRIEAPAEALFPVTLGDSDRLRVGMRVFALGNPFGLERSMSQGCISSLNRTLEVQRNWVIKSIIQIDASINPGNSGGPLINSHGQLIGINTAIASRVEQSAGIGFAIPVNLIRRVVPDLIQSGRVRRGDVGITQVTVTDKGLRIARLSTGGPAERAGVKGPQITKRGPWIIEDRSAADIVTAIDGQTVKTAAEFIGLVESKKPGDVIELTLLRKDQTVKVQVTLGGEEPAPTTGSGV